MNIEFDPIEAVLDEIRQGHLVIVTDDANRENEGDLILAAEKATPELIKVKCDAHEWMHAWVWEFDHPYFATTGADGRFTIKDVPPGSYTLVAWQEAAGEKSMPVTVTAGATVTSDIQLQAK